MIPVEFRRLFGTVRLYRAWLVVGAVLLAFSGMGNALLPLMIRPILDRVLVPHSPDSSAPTPLVTLPWNHHTIYLNSFFPHSFHNPGTIFAIALIAIFIFKGLTEFAGTIIVQYTGLSAVTDLRNRVYAPNPMRMAIAT